MSEARVIFEERGFDSLSTYRFYEDRIERDWKMLFRHGRDSYRTANIAEHLSEQTTFAFGVSQLLRRMAVFLVVGLILHFGYDRAVLHRIGQVLFACAVLFGVVAVIRLRKDTWLYVKQRDGGTLFTIRVSGLRGITREDFIREIQRYAKNDQLADEPNADTTPRQLS